MTVSAPAVVQSAPRCRTSSSPRSPVNRLSPAQNDGRSGVIGDCRVAKSAVTSGKDWTASSRSGRRNRSSITSAIANSRPISISTSRARRAGKTLTSPSVSKVPIAEGITTKGTTLRTATA
jgi:hypothetical protein